MRKRVFVFAVFIFSAFVFIFSNGFAFGNYAEAAEPGKFIRWVDFNAKSEVLQKAYEFDKLSLSKPVHLNWIELLACCACKNGNNFSVKSDIAYMRKVVARIEKGETAFEVSGKSKYYQYYFDCFSAVLSEYVGWYKTIEGKPEYGLKAYFPLASGYGYSGSDDFGNSRSYGFRRPHLGHDMFGSVGTPVTAVEGGVITEMGWNKYGGWRIGVRSFDGLRYYYYAHLRKDKPYGENIKKGDTVAAGQVVGYLGVTGYSNKENVNMSGKPHLHFGMQLIFDKSQEDGNGEIWIDVYQLCRFLSKNRAKTERMENGHRVSVGLREPVGF